MTIAKAVTSLLVTFLTLILGDNAVEEFDIGALEALIAALIPAIAVYAVPNTAGPR